MLDRTKMKNVRKKGEPFLFEKGSELNKTFLDILLAHKRRYENPQMIADGYKHTTYDI